MPIAEADSAGVDSTDGPDVAHPGNPPSGTCHADDTSAAPVRDRSPIMTLGVVEDEPGLPRRIVGSVQDVTSARRLDRQLAAHLAVTRALDDWTSLEQGAEGLLGRLAEAMDFVFGAFSVPDGAYFGAPAIWRMPTSVLESVTETTIAAELYLSPATVKRHFERATSSPRRRGPCGRRRRGDAPRLDLPGTDADQKGTKRPNRHSRRCATLLCADRR